eukprot:SAG11_NODE_2536_length_3245_cov_3.417673_5_plen_206_part_00
MSLSDHRYSCSLIRSVTYYGCSYCSMAAAVASMASIKVQFEGAEYAVQFSRTADAAAIERAICVACGVPWGSVTQLADESGAVYSVDAAAFPDGKELFLEVFATPGGGNCRTVLASQCTYFSGRGSFARGRKMQRQAQIIATRTTSVRSAQILSQRAQRRLDQQPCKPVTCAVSCLAAEAATIRQPLEVLQPAAEPEPEAEAEGA